MGGRPVQYLKTMGVDIQVANIARPSPLMVFDHYAMIVETLYRLNRLSRVISVNPSNNA